MKRKITILLGVVLLIVAGMVGSKAFVVKAAGDYTGTPLILTRVNDIDPYNNYTPNYIPIDNSITKNEDGGHVYKFTIEKDGFIEMRLSAKEVKKTVIGNTGKANAETDAKITATIYRDEMLLYPVGPPLSATGPEAKNTLNKIALDKGTYYVAFVSDRYNNGNSFTHVYGKAIFLNYYQEANSYEIYRPSKVEQENPLTMENEFKGILTTTNPKDYYRFQLTEKALLKINFMYSSKNTAKFTLYSTEREELVTKTVAGNNVWYNVEKYLEPGVYYCSLESITVYDGGLTSILINQTVYPLNLKKKNDNVNSYVTVDTIDDPKEIRYVLGKLTNSELASPKWNSGKVITEALKFGVNKNGYYTVRVTDQYGNMFMQTISITSSDKKAPSKPKVKSYKAGSFIVSGTAEKKSTVTVSINGRAFTCTTSSKGNYKCELPYILSKNSKIEVTAQDISGNISSKASVVVR